MKKNILRLRLDFRHPKEKYICKGCFEEYKLFQSFHKVKADGDGGYIIFFASPETGFANAEVVALPQEKLKASDLPLASDDYDFNKWKKLYTLLFKDKNGRVIWPRLRSMLTQRYRHPELPKDKSCPVLEEKGEFSTLGPPKTIFMWAEPLIVALYALGNSYREIVGILELAHPEEKRAGVKNSVGRRIQNYQRKYEEDEKLDLLHDLNLGKYKFSMEYPPNGIVWEIVIEDKPLNDLTVAWLKTLAKRYKDSFEVILAESEVIAAAVYL